MKQLNRFLALLIVLAGVTARNKPLAASFRGQGG